MAITVRPNIIIIATALFVVLLTTTPSGDAYGTGAPPEACATLRPGHVPFKPQDPSLVPHRYAAEFHRESRDRKDADVVLIRLNGDTIAGFVAQVHDDSGSAIGQFSVENRYCKLLSCFEENDSITHNSGIVKKDIDFSWRPTKIQSGKLRLNATIAKTMRIYWTDVIFEIPQEFIQSYNISDTQETEDTKADTKDGIHTI